ncbi:nucleotidyltransferase family protein [Ancylobacter terrae]|uniref:nucleotidyltransferase family protein n=1 Tax=Ancylobacter sp. sgz301288 TaxID=3342077 RepID=UPI00385AC6B5
MSQGWVSPFPDPMHVLLLRAGLESGDAAIDVFSQWSARNDLREPVDEATFSLLPQAYHNLSRLGCESPQMALLKGVYRHSWAATQLQLKRAVQVVSLVADAGVELMASKGLALVRDYYASPALRPITDIELYVPRRQALAAVRALEASGWSADAHWRSSPEHTMVRRPSVLLHDSSGAKVELCWDILSECQSQQSNDRFWAHSESFSILDGSLRRPNSTYLLLHIIVAGVRYTPFSPVRWVNDAAMVLRRDDQPVDWSELHDAARQAMVSHRLLMGLRYLRDTLGFDVVLPAETPPTTAVERIESRFFLRDHASMSHRARHRSAVFAYLARLLSSDRRRHLPSLLLRKVARNLRRPSARA